MARDRKVIPISITGSAKQIIKAIADEHGMKEIAVTSRIYEWFAQQDDVVRKGVLRLLPKGYEAEVARLALERIISDTKRPKKPSGP